jgi:hypothetical protein
LFDATHRMSDDGTIFDVLDARQVRAVCEAFENAELDALFGAGFDQTTETKAAQIASEGRVDTGCAKAKNRWRQLDASASWERLFCDAARRELDARG